MNAESYRIVDEFWAQDLGMTSAAFAERPRLVCTPQHLHSGVQLFRQGERLVIAAPPAMLGLIENSVENLSVDHLFSINWLQQTCGQDAEKIIGPAEVNYADSSTFQYSGRPSGRKMSPQDSAAYSALAGALDPKEIEDSGFSADKFPAFGAFSNSTLCAAASYSVWEPSIAHIIVATDPDHRRRGFASAAVRALADDAFGSGLILQWRALAANKKSLAMAERLGFRHYCSALYARIRA